MPTLHLDDYLPEELYRNIEKMNVRKCRECDEILIVDGGDLDENRYGGYCADCFDEIHGSELEDEIDDLINDGADFVAVQYLD